MATELARRPRQPRVPALVKDGHDQWMVDDRLCILCGACKEVAPGAMTIVDRFGPGVVPSAAAAAGGGG